MSKRNMFLEWRGDHGYPLRADYFIMGRMSRKTIAVDIDDVLAVNSLAFLEYSNKKWGTNLTIEDFHEDWATMWNIDHDEVVDRIKHMDEVRLFRQFGHIEDAMPVLQKLAQKY